MKLPKIPTSWNWLKVGELGADDRPAVKAGPFGSALKKEFYTSSGYRIYGQEQVIAGDLSIGNYYIGQDRFEKLQSCEVRSGDILISLVGTFGKILVVPENFEPGIINPRLVRLSLDLDRIEPKFFSWFFQSPLAQLQMKLQSHGGTMGILNAKNIAGLFLPLPPIAEQSRIAAILDKADAVRRKRKEAISLTEELLRSAFLDMFGDPVVNPKGWDEIELGKLLAEIIDYRGKTPKKSSSGIPLISAANVHNGRVDLSYEQYISQKDYENWTTRGFTQPGDVLITTEAPVGEVAAYPASGTYQISRRIMALRPNSDKVTSCFLLHSMLSPNWLERLKRVTRGSTVPRVLKPDILGQLIPCPPVNLQLEFDAFASEHSRLTQREEAMPQQTDNLFNSLLQRAFRGDL